MLKIYISVVFAKQHEFCVLRLFPFLCIFLYPPGFGGEGRCLCVCVCAPPYIHMLDYHWRAITKG